MLLFIAFSTCVVSAEEEKSLVGTLLYAHRGLTCDEPENSLGSVRAAMDSGLYGSEVDLRTSRDGIVVSMHDETLERTSTGQGRVADKDLAELKTFFLKTSDNRVTGEKIPTLEEILALAATSSKFTLALDMKDVDVSRAGRAVLDKGMADRVFFFIADPLKDVNTAKAIKALDRRLQIAVDLLSWWKIEGLPTFVSRALDADALFASEWFFPEFGFQEARRAGVPVFVYIWGTHDLKNRFDHAVELGADVVSCDRPERLKSEKVEEKAEATAP